MILKVEYLIVAGLLAGGLFLIAENRSLAAANSEYQSTVEELSDEVEIQRQQIDLLFVEEARRAEAEREEALQYAEDGLINLEDGPVAEVLQRAFESLP